MIITCEECSTRFTLDDALIKPEGSKVRCGQCKHVFTAFLPDQDLPDFDTPAAELEMDDQEPDLAALDEEDTGDIPFDDPGLPEDEDLAIAPGDDVDFDPSGDLDFEQDDDLDFEPADDLEFEPQDDDLAFDDQEIEFDGIEFDDMPEPDSPQPDQDDAGLELEIEETSEAGPPPEPDADSDGDLAFDAGDDLDLEDTDLTLEEPGADEPELDFDAGDLDLQEEDLTLDTQDDLEFEDIQPIEEEPASDLSEDAGEEGADIEISFDGDDSGMDLEITPVEPQEEDIPDSDLEEITFDVEDADSDLELVFDEDADTDLVFEDPGEDLDIQAPAVETDVSPGEDLTLEPEAADEPDLSLDEEEEEPAPALSRVEEAGEDPDAEKFSSYDQVLDQDTEPEVSVADEPPELPEMPYEPEPEIEVEEEPPEETPQPEAAMITPPTATDARKKRAKKSAVGAPVKILFLLFLLVIAAYVASLKLGADIPFLSQINIPYVTDILKPAPQAEAPLKPVPNEASINGRFVSNASAGELFIVTGRIENPSKKTYSHIRVKGTLLTKDKAKAGTQTAFCGNIISEETLKTGNILDINQQMTVKEGRQNTNVNIKPGSSVMFMIVFSKLPENLTNFTVEVVDFKTENGK